MYRLVPRLVFPWLLVAHTVLTAGDRSAALPVGCYVLARRPGVRFHVQNKDVGEMPAGLIQRVQKVQGDWAWLGRGWVLQRDLIRAERAIEFFTSEIKRKPTAFAYVARAGATAKPGIALPDVDRDLDAALRLDRDFAAAYWQRGIQLYMCRDFSNAIDAYDEAIFLDPKLADAYNDRGGAWVWSGRKDKAVKDFERAIRLCPRLAKAHANRAILLDEKGERELAFSSASESLKHDPAELQACLVIGRYWVAKGDDDRALAAYGKAIECDPECGDAYLARGKLYSQQADFQKALIDLDRAIELMPKDFAARDARGYVYYRLNEPEKSRAEHLAATRLRPSSAVAQTLATDSGDKKDSDKKKPATASSFNSQATATNDKTDKSWVPDVKPNPARELDRAARRAATSADERYLNAAKAVEDATEACQTTDWERADFIDTLAAAYAAAGDFEEAVKWQTKAIQLGNLSPTMRSEASERLELYKAQKRCREEKPGWLARDPNPGSSVR
ncbi:MAG TPA: tetratricopeptide repeat protein [Pirellulales bacterium]|nr:tetratricopeptide repeat protein [Pirellulales bacterium]